MNDQETNLKPRAPTVGDEVLYWPPKRPGQPFIPFSRKATVAGVGEDEVMLSVANAAGGRFRATAARAPRAAHPDGGWSWPEQASTVAEPDDTDD